MKTPARILIADDDPDGLEIVQARLAGQGYDIQVARNGEEALTLARTQGPDLVLLDVMMPRLSGLEVCRRLKGDTSLPFTPIIMVTARAGPEAVIAGLDAGADEYLTKPLDQHALLARVRSMLRIKALHDAAQDQAMRLQRQAAELAAWNRELERRVAEQVAELERLSRLKRFLPPSLAERILAAGGEDPLASHRREVTVVFLDLRGFTAFAETAEPEEVMGVLRGYHRTMGELVQRYEGTLERFTGDGLMVFFNDPVPMADATERALRMALAMREAGAALGSEWHRRDIELGLGIGIARGYATIGAIGYEDRIDYGAIGTVTNQAARLCAEAPSGEIFASRKTLVEVAHLFEVEELGEVRLKGFSRTIPVMRVIAAKSSP